MSQTAARPHILSRLTLGQVALIALLILVLWAIGSVLLLVFFAVLLAASLRGAADAIATHARIPVQWALPLIILTLAAALAGIAYWIGPILFAQINDLANRLLGEVDRVRHYLGDNGLMQGNGQLQTLAERAVSPATAIFTFSLTTLTELFVALVTAIYFAAAPGVYVGGMVRLVPIPYRARLRHVIDALAHILRMWVLGQMINMLAVGILASVGLSLVGVPAPVALGVIAGLFTFVPYIGSITSGVIATLIALSAGLTTATWAVGVFVLCHLFEGYVIAPLVQRRILELPPALSVLSMTILGTLFGLPGIILGTPFAAALLVLVQSLYIGDVLGDHAVDPTQPKREEPSAA